MSRVEGYRDDCYLFSYQGTMYSLSRESLYYLFFAFDQCVDPYETSQRLTEVGTLLQLAQENNDHALVLLLLQDMKVSLRPQLLLERPSRTILEQLLSIGLYLSGWGGREEPFPTSFHSVSNRVATEMIIEKLIREIRITPEYVQIKEYRLVHFQQESEKRFSFASGTIDDLLERLLSSGPERDNELAREAIGTAYYYLSQAYLSSYSMLESLLSS